MSHMWSGKNNPFTIFIFKKHVRRYAQSIRYNSNCFFNLNIYHLDMDYLLKLKFDELPRSLNVTLRSHFHLRSKENHRWYDLVYFMTRGKTPLKPLEKCHIKITRSSYRMLDWDSVVASIKPVVDGLVRAGIMIDDTYKVTGPWEVDQKFLQKKQGKLLEVEISGTH